MIPDHFYITGLGLAVYATLYLPLAYALVKMGNRLLKGIWKKAWPRLAIVVPAGLLVASAPMLEVYSISMDAQRLCREQAGLKVYRVVEADGFLGEGLGKRLVEYGYTYAEDGGTQNRKFRQTIKNGKVITEQIEEYSARYRVKGGDNHRVIGSHFSRSSDVVVDRQTGEVLGELGVIGIFPGLLDNIAIALTGMGSGFNPWACGEEAPPGRTFKLGAYDLIMATIQPSGQHKGEQK